MLKPRDPRLLRASIACFLAAAAVAFGWYGCATTARPAEVAVSAAQAAGTTIEWVRARPGRSFIIKDDRWYWFERDSQGHLWKVREFPVDFSLTTPYTPLPRG